MELLEYWVETAIKRWIFWFNLNNKNKLFPNTNLIYFTSILISITKWTFSEGRMNWAVRPAEYDYFLGLKREWRWNILVECFKIKFKVNVKVKVKVLIKVEVMINDAIVFFPQKLASSIFTVFQTAILFEILHRKRSG